MLGISDRLAWVISEITGVLYYGSLIYFLFRVRFHGDEFKIILWDKLFLGYIVLYIAALFVRGFIEEYRG